MNNYSIIIDVRSPQEFAGGHLEGAENVPLDQMQQWLDAHADLEKSSEIMLYCKSGARSAIACSFLRQRGFSRAINGGSIAILAMNFRLAATNTNANTNV
jgi:phage shock protein E